MIHLVRGKPFATQREKLSEEVGDKEGVEQALQNFILYRFQSEFGKMTSEVRMIYTPDDQVAGLSVIPWNGHLQ
jgi:hypothetical protein